MRNNFEKYEEEVRRGLNKDHDENVDGDEEKQFRPPIAATNSEVRRAVRFLDPAKNSKYQKRDDLGAARLFADVYQRIARYNVTAACWFTFDGKRWCRDRKDVNVLRYAGILVRVLQHYAIDCDSDEYKRFCDGLGRKDRIQAMLRLAISFYPVAQEDFDTQSHLLNCRNGVLDLDTGDLLPHDPELLLSRMANVEYRPEATCEEFLKFMDEIFEEDRGRICYLQQLLGYSLVGEADREECYFLYGPSTRNGKGTLLETICSLMGDYADHIQPETLADRDRRGGSPSPDLAKLQGVRFLRASEPRKSMRLNAALLKQLTGRDPLTARFLNQDEFTFIPMFKLFVNTNYLPVTTDQTLFASDRIRVIPFNRHFGEGERDPGLKDRLKRKDSLSGVLNWLLDGLHRYQEEGCLTVPPAVLQATETYRQDSDKIQIFFKECMEEAPDENTPAGSVFDRFQEWCRESSYYPDSKGRFFSELRSRGLMADTGTVYGRTVRNVVPGWKILE